MSSYAEPSDFLVAGFAGLVVGVAYAAWAARHGWHARPALVAAVAASMFLGLGLGLVVQEEWPGGWTTLDCEVEAQGCAATYNAPAPLLLMVVVGGAAGCLVAAGHGLPWRRGTSWVMLSLPLAAAAIVATDADVRVGPWVAAWVLWLALLPGAVRAAWPAGRAGATPRG